MKTFHASMKHLSVLILPAIIILSVLVNCENDLKDEVFTTSEGIMMAEYFELHSDTFGEFYKVLEKTNSVSFLNAYGTYTCFAPTNEAFMTFYNEHGKSSIDDFNSAEDIDLLRQILRFHICADSISTGMFEEGGLPDTTMSGDYLITTFGEGGINDIMVNKEAKIIKRDISVVNGIIHGIDKVMNPVVLTVAEKIEQQGNFSIFAEALKQTGLYDSLNIRNIRVTVFAETDSAFAQEGITSYEDLFKEYSQTGEPYLNFDDSLYLWVAYHCMDQVLFLTDFSNLTYGNLTHSVLFTVVKGSEFLVNKTPVAIDISNNSARNGVFHALEGLLKFIPTPVAIYYDMLDKPELRALTDYFRKKTLAAIPGPELPDGVQGIHVESGITWKYGYQNKWYNQNDFFEYQFSAADNKLWFEFDTPALVKDASYKIWVCGKCVNGNRATADVYWDGNLVFRLDMGVEYSGTPEDYDTDGKKHYTTPVSPQSVGFLIGTFTITEEGPHKIKFVGVTDGYYTLDMIQFIPADENQYAEVFTRP